MRTPNPPADYSEICPEIESLMKSLGLDVRVMEGKEGKPNVVGLWRGSDSAGPTLLLDGHMDVIAPGEGWEMDPWAAAIRDGTLWGRGTVDMKHSLAIMIAVTKALREAGFHPKGNLMLSATNDDETAGKFGLKYVVEKGFADAGWPAPDFHLLLEPSNWGVNVAYKGRVWTKVTVKGKSAHGGAPEKGANAIVKMTELIGRALSMAKNVHPLMGTDSINVGTITGGEKTNVVPDACTATFDYRFVGPCTAKDAVERFRSAVSLDVGDSDYRISEFEVFESRDPLEVDPSAGPVALLSETIRGISGRPAKPSGTLSAGNAYWSLSNGILGTMTGPGDPGLMHTNREHIAISDLLEGARIVAAYVVRYLG